jgi:hypothetical protein
MKEMDRLMVEILLIKKSLLAMENNSLVLGGWLTKNAVLRYFDYCDNQLRNLERTHSIEVSKIGRRKFYSMDSILTLIEKNRVL